MLNIDNPSLVHNHEPNTPGNEAYASTARQLTAMIQRIRSKNADYWVAPSELSEIDILCNVRTE
jgi:hypothetical protein